MNTATEARITIEHVRDELLQQASAARQTTAKHLSKILATNQLIKQRMANRIEFAKPLIGLGETGIIFHRTINVLQGQSGVHSVLRLSNYRLGQCLFGLHQLKNRAFDARVVVVGSEKTPPKTTGKNGYDFADFLVNRDEQAGWAMTDFDYPCVWGFRKNCFTNQEERQPSTRTTGVKPYFLTQKDLIC